jgi:hypothetical protein
MVMMLALGPLVTTLRSSDCENPPMNSNFENHQAMAIGIDLVSGNFVNLQAVAAVLVSDHFEDAASRRPTSCFPTLICYPNMIGYLSVIGYPNMICYLNAIRYMICYPNNFSNPQVISRVIASCSFSSPQVMAIAMVSYDFSNPESKNWTFGFSNLIR